MTQTSHLDRHDTLGSPHLDVNDVLRGMDLGIVTHELGGFVVADRQCGAVGCSVLLPKYTRTGHLDTFTRCCDHVDPTLTAVHIERGCSTR
jgi:hypothetical protein